MITDYNKDTIDMHEYKLIAQQASELQETKDLIIKKQNEDDCLEDHGNSVKSDTTLSKLKIASVICLIFMILEIIGGYLANSIAIMSDAAHLLSDLLGFIISIVSIYISRKRANHKMSFGYHRAEVIGALFSVCLIWGLTIWLLFEASSRLVSRKPVNGFIMLITAIIGFVFNIVMGLVLAYQGIDHHLHHHHDEDGDHHEHSNQIKEHKHQKADKHHHSHEHSEQDHDDHHDHKNHHETEDKKHFELTLGNSAENLKSLGELRAKELGGNIEKHNHSEKKNDRRNKANEYGDDHHKSHSHGHKNSKEHNNEHGHSHSDHSHHGHGHSHDNLNLRASLIHVIGDAVQNLGVVIAGLIIYFYPEYSIADPICTFVFSIIVVFTTIRILKEGISVLMEATPVEINLKKLERELKGIPHVVEIHDLHVWSLSPGKLSLSCHLISTLPQDSLKAARNHLKTKYKITHSTIQVELDSGDERENCSHDLHQEFSLNSK